MYLYGSGMCQREGAGGAHAHPGLGRSEGAAGSAGAPNYCVPPPDF